jgi:predicted nucleic acid-binding protein
LLEALASAWIEIQPTGNLRGTAERLLAVHPLRAADAFQLAAALQWCRGQTAGMSIVSFDDRLRDAAHKEGFNLLPPE